MPIQSEHLGDGICLVKISNPGKRNALDMEMFQSLARLWPSPGHQTAVIGPRNSNDRASSQSRGLSSLENMERKDMGFAPDCAQICVGLVCALPRLYVSGGLRN